jgi:hypothetical protein
MMKVFISQEGTTQSTLWAAVPNVLAWLAVLQHLGNS